MPRRTRPRQTEHPVGIALLDAAGGCVPTDAALAALPATPAQRRAIAAAARRAAHLRDEGDFAAARAVARDVFGELLDDLPEWRLPGDDLSPDELAATLPRLY